MNTQVQGISKLIMSVNDNTKTFRTNILLWEIQMKRAKLVYFEFLRSLNLSESYLKFTDYAQNIELLRSEGYILQNNVGHVRSTV